MVRIILELKEEFIKEFKDVQATSINVDYKEIGIKATKGEQKASKLIKDRIGYKNGNVEIINNSTSEKLDKLLKILQSI